MTFGAYELVRTEPYLDYTHANSDNAASAIYSDVWKKFYVGAHPLSRPYTAVELYSYLSAIYTKWCEQTFLPYLWNFCNFRPQFCENCGATPPGDENWDSDLPERAIPSEKNGETASKSIYKP